MKINSNNYTIQLTARNPMVINSVYKPLDEYKLDADIKTITGNDECQQMILYIKNISQSAFRGVIQLKLCVLDGNPKFYMPAFMYNRNRGNEEPYRNRQGEIASYPRLSREKPQQVPYSDYWMVRADRLSHPTVSLLSGNTIYGLSVNPLSSNGSIFNGFSCWLGELESCIGFSLGYENSPWLYVDLNTINDANYGCITIQEGETLTVPFNLYTLNVEDERGLNKLIRDVYIKYHQKPRKGATIKSAVQDIAGAIFSDSYVAACKTYSTRVFLQDENIFQEPLASISWTGGVEVAAPMLFSAARLQDQQMREQALSVIQNIVNHSLNPSSNLPYDAYNNNQWYTEGWWDRHLYQKGHCSYLIGQALYYILLSYDIEKKYFACEHTDWLIFVKQCLEHIETTKDEHGEVPYIWSSETGEGLEYDSFAGCWCVAAATLYNKISPHPELLTSAEKSILFYYKRFVRRMECYATPIDTMKAIDSEGILSFIKASRLLHEKTGKKIYLDMLSDGLEYEFTFKFCWNPPIQIDPLKKLGWSCCGGSVTSTCNPHIHPMSNNVCDEIKYCYLHTQDEYFAQRLEDTINWSLQTYSTFDNEYDFGKKGWMSERFCYSEGLLIETYDNGEPCSTWKCFLPWGASNILEGLCGSVWEDRE